MMKGLAKALVVLTGLSGLAVGQKPSYGVDVSFPFQHNEWTPLNEERKEVYENFMQGWYVPVNVVSLSFAL